MRRIFRLSALALALGAATACARPETIIETEDIPTAGVRFVNAVPDTMAMDFRPVDIVENTHSWSVSFRSTTNLFYRNARAGDRHFKIFLSNPSLGAPSAEQFAIAGTVIEDINVTLEAGKNYTFILWGYMRPGSTPAKRLTIIEDNPNDPGTSSIALRIVNAAAGLGAVDGYAWNPAGTRSATPTWGNVGELTASSYVTFPTSGIRSNFRLAGGTVDLTTDKTLSAGIAETIDIDAVPGTTLAGTAMTGFVLPRSVSGSKAPNLTTPTMFWVWDRRPPRTCALC